MDMAICAFNFHCLPDAPFHVLKMAKWILHRSSPRAVENLRLAFLGNLHTAIYVVILPGRRNCNFSEERARRGPGVGTNECQELSVMKMGWLVAFQEDSTMLIDYRKS